MTTLEPAAARKLFPTDARVIPWRAWESCCPSLLFLVDAFVQDFFILDRAGHGIANHFVNVWAALRLVLDGHPAAAYDWTVHRQVQEAAVGYAFNGEHRWHYPPLHRGDHAGRIGRELHRCAADRAARARPRAQAGGVPRYRLISTARLPIPADSPVRPG